MSTAFKSSPISRRQLVSYACAITVGAVTAHPKPSLAGNETLRTAYAQPLGRRKVVYAYGPSGAGLVTVNVIRLMLQRLGYDVELRSIDSHTVYQALAIGRVDLFSSAYLPGQQQYLDAEIGKVEILSVSYGPVSAGLMVPAYVAVSKIEDLNDPTIRERLGGTIVGIDADASVMAQTKIAIERYALDLELVSGSDATMAAAFKSAYDTKKPIVVTSYSPHYLCALYDIKFLRDDKNIFQWSQDYHLAHANFRADFPRATSYLARSTLTADSVSKMMKWVAVDGMRPEQASERFVAENPALVWYWIGDLVEGVQKPQNI